MVSTSLHDVVAQQIERLSLKKFQWLVFPAQLEQRFERDTCGYRSARLWIEGLVAIVLFNVLLLANHLLIPSVSWRAVLLRSAIVTPVSLLVNIGMLFNPSRVYRESSIAFASCVICFTHLYLERGGSAIAPTFAQVGVIVTVLFATVVMRLQFFYALWASLVMMAGDVVYVLTDSLLMPEEKVFGLSLTMCAVAITMMANYSLGREERLGYLLRLRGEMDGAVLALDNEELQRISNLDALTGIANRHAFEREFHHLWNAAIETQSPLSAVLIDVDHFKKLNDVSGHLYGDKVLKRVATLLTQALRSKDDFAARFGGEEFVVLLPGTGPAGSLLLAERIRKLVEVAGSPVVETANTDAMSVWTTVSCGVATVWPTQSSSKEQLLNSADQALYQAKSNGRNSVCCCDMALVGDEQ